jgi:glycosyltransferase involved in cell wall biosynthesis
MDATALRIALFSGNYNYIRDGANQALNRLVEHLLRHGAAVRIYSPTVAEPAFPRNGDVVHIPNFSIPRRKEYKFPLMLPLRVRRDVRAFRPNLFHVASPDMLGHSAASLAYRMDVPVVASVHTRFETYFRYYGLGFVEPFLEAIFRRFYQRCDAIFAPSESMAELLREQRMSCNIGIWTRGIDREIFNPGHRDMAWRRGQGIADDQPVVGFVGRLVMEKGLGVFAETIARLRSRQVRHKVLVVGDGPAQDWFRRRLPGAIFAGFREGEELSRAIASMDLLFNPSVTETFGNVTLEAMAAGLPVVAAVATGSRSLVEDGRTGRLVPAGAVEGFADALEAYCRDPELRRAAGRAGCEASRRYGWDEVNQALVDGYIRVVCQRRSGARPPFRGPFSVIPGSTRNS